MPKLYNLSWAEPIYAQNRPYIPLRDQATINLPPLLGAVILWPALLTPEVHVRADEDSKDAATPKNWIEILLLARDDMPDITATHVNRRLQILPGFDVIALGTSALFPTDVGKNIRVESVSKDGNGILRTKNKFTGILHKLALKGFPSAYTKFWSVSINPAVLDAAGPPTAPKLEPTTTPQNRVVAELLAKRNGTGLPLQGMYEFSQGNTDVDLSEPNTSRPIVARHPLVVFGPDEMQWASFAHASDIHINGRQQILSRSAARVIDGAPPPESRPVGEMINVCSQAFGEILRGVPPDVHALLIGGDLIDHMQNAWTKWGPGAASFDPRKVWTAVDLKDGYDDKYQACLDLITFYTMVTGFYRQRSLPVFGVSGNHDCYEKAFGISPRTAFGKANEGIPADNNLTFYEALLVFGRTFGTLKKNGDPFNADLFDWFYTVLTPWADYAVKLRKQRVVGLEWGDDEDILQKGQGQNDAFFGGHLPRASESVSDAQMALFLDGLSEDMPTVLMTHFTFVSYRDSISILDDKDMPGIAGSVNLRPRNFGDFDFGTFKQGRTGMYNQVADCTKVHAVFTGHSHRKGLYFLNQRKMVLDSPTKMYNFDTPIQRGDLAEVSGETPIIVSDSGGPLPRFNLKGEFQEWGSDRPAGTVAYFGQQGLQSVQALRAANPRTLPRVVVALDYLHWQKDGLIAKFETDPIAPRDEDDADFGMYVWLKCDAVAISRISFYSKASDKLPWGRAAATWEKGTNRFVVPATDRSKLRDWMKFGTSSGRFLSIDFVPKAPWIMKRYSFADPWNVQAYVTPYPVYNNYGGLTGEKRWMISVGKPSGPPEGPDFDWRTRQYATMYP